jgi:hypothetical protein
MRKLVGKIRHIIYISSILNVLIVLNVRFDDSASQSSGDSVLIGVEDQKDFKDYRDRSQVTFTLFNPYRYGLGRKLPCCVICLFLHKLTGLSE